MAQSLDAHQRPPSHLRDIYKKFQRLRGHALESDPGLIDLTHTASANQFRILRSLDSTTTHTLFQNFSCADTEQSPAPVAPVPVYEHPSMPGLHVIPSLFPPDIQKLLLSRLIHRDLSDQAHKTNVHMHYEVPYPHNQSFFSMAPSPEPLFLPKDPRVHKPLSINQFLGRKLRWVTLGGQYDWTEKVYPSTPPPPFPPDIGELLQGLFPDMRADAAIVNFYTPGDTLSMHRDVSEECERGLVSISIGCDGIFVIGRNDEDETDPSQTLALRLRSGDAVFMSGESRFAWHGVPQVIPETCPEWLKDWPARSADEAGEPGACYEQWKGWMRTKRINVNVRQMKE
ncbi:oxidoreductase [Phyllosticta citricarpa]|uniref:Oxidoreductase n=2 Tax=Phyllosticta TaxID=121621 RepID=A0ABR1LUK9_9PEZI